MHRRSSATVAALLVGATLLSPLPGEAASPNQAPKPKIRGAK